MYSWAKRTKLDDAFSIRRWMEGQLEVMELRQKACTCYETNIFELLADCIRQLPSRDVQRKVRHFFHHLRMPICN